MELFALCTRQPGNELIAAECQHLTGGSPDEYGLATCQNIDLIPQAAYIHTGTRLLFKAANLDDLVTQISATPFPCDEFAIEFQRLSPANPARSRGSIIAIANALEGCPNLDHPRHRFLLLALENGLWFGEIRTKINHGYHSHDEKPYRTSTSLPARLARALVNLAWPTKSILDPCCGTGTILVEACALGLEAVGVDKNPRMVGMSRGNLSHFGYHAAISRGDARQIDHTADAVITDLPYGRYCHSTPQEIRDILNRAAKLAPVGIFVTEGDLTEWLYESGYTSVETWRVPKRAEMSRLVHRARRSL